MDRALQTHRLYLPASLMLSCRPCATLDKQHDGVVRYLGATQDDARKSPYYATYLRKPYLCETLTTDSDFTRTGTRTRRASSAVIFSYARDYALSERRTRTGRYDS